MERRAIETEVGKRMPARRTWPTNLGSNERRNWLKRENTQVDRPILDLSGDLDAARQELAPVLNLTSRSTEKEQDCTVIVPAA